MKVGDYVLATKWSDGDPGDQWCVGFYFGYIGDRQLVVDSAGKLFRRNGFRRVKKISQARGEFILAHTDLIQRAGRSLWWWARCSLEVCDG